MSAIICPRTGEEIKIKCPNKSAALSSVVGRRFVRVSSCLAIKAAPNSWAATSNISCAHQRAQRSLVATPPKRNERNHERTTDTVAFIVFAMSVSVYHSQSHHCMHRQCLHELQDIQLPLRQYILGNILDTLRNDDTPTSVMSCNMNYITNAADVQQLYFIGRAKTSDANSHHSGMMATGGPAYQPTKKKTPLDTHEDGQSRIICWRRSCLQPKSYYYIAGVASNRRTILVLFRLFSFHSANANPTCDR